VYGSSTSQGHRHQHKHDRLERNSILENDNKDRTREKIGANSLTDSDARTTVDDLAEVNTPVEEGEELEPMNEDISESNAMAALMGFGNFDTTKNKEIGGNQVGAANVKKPRTWRQYMNRRGGFNRPLDKIK